MKVLLVSNMYPSDQHPSYGTFVKNSKDMLEDNNIKVDISIMTKKASKRKKILGYLQFYIKSFLKSLKKEYDIAYIHYPSLSALPVIAASWFRPARIYVNLHGSDVLAKNKKQQLVNFITSIAVKKAEKILCPSDYFKNLVIQKYDLPSEKVEVFASGGVDSSIFSPNIKREEVINEFNLSQTEKYVGFIGRMENGKGWLTYLKAMRKIMDRYDTQIKGIVVGGGSQKNLFQEQVVNLGLSSNIIFFEALSQKQLGRLMHCFDLFCFPTESESLGLVGIEALASGVPVVGSNISVLRGYLSHGENGFLAETNQEESFAEHITYILNMEKSDYENMQLKALDTAKPYYKENIEERFIDVFRNNN